MEEADHNPNLLAAYLEDRLDDAEKQRLLGHLTTCADCRGTLALLGRAASAGDVPLPSVRDRPPRERRWRVATRNWLPVAASVAIAAAIGIRTASRPSPLPIEPPERPALPQPREVGLMPALAPSAASSPASAQPSGRPEGVIDESLLAKRGTSRHVAGKVFRLASDEWLDVGFDPAAALPIVSVKGAEERAAVLARLPALTPYAALGDRVSVLFEGTVYRFSP
jgi:anti-sigma factor RsiW